MSFSKKRIARSQFRTIQEDDGRWIVEHKSSGEKHGWYRTYSEALSAGYAEFGQPGVNTKVSVKLGDRLNKDVGDSVVTTIDFWDEYGERDTAVDCRVTLLKRGAFCSQHFAGYWWEVKINSLINPLPGGLQLIGPVGEIEEE